MKTTILALVAVGLLHGCGAAPTPGARHPTREACTAFVLRTGGRVLAGKNLDWPVGEGAVLLNPRGLAHAGVVTPPESPARWVSRYASLTFNQLGQGFPLGGLNEAGLVVEELSYGPARYPDPDSRPALSELQWIQYQLDTHRTVDDVAADTAIRIAPLLFGLHYLVADAAGDVAAIEFLDGERVVSTAEDLPVAVLANDTYRNLVRYLGFHEGFGGDRVVGPGPESPERFVRAATSVRRIEAAGNAIGRRTDGAPLTNAALTDSAFAILDDVAQDDTRWSIVYDAGSLEARYRTASRPGRRAV